MEETKVYPDGWCAICGRHGPVEWLWPFGWVCVWHYWFNEPAERARAEAEKQKEAEKK